MLFVVMEVGNTYLFRVGSLDLYDDGKVFSFCVYVFSSILIFICRIWGLGKYVNFVISVRSAYLSLGERPRDLCKKRDVYVDVRWALLLTCGVRCLGTRGL